MSPSSSSRASGPEFSQGRGAGPGSPWGTGGQPGVDGAERAGWSLSVRGWICQVSARGPHLREKLRPDHARARVAPQGRQMCLSSQGGRGLVAELAAAELPGSQGEGKPGRRPSSARASRRLMQAGPSGPARPVWALGLKDEAHPGCTVIPGRSQGGLTPDSDQCDTSHDEIQIFLKAGATLL